MPSRARGHVWLGTDGVWRARITIAGKQRVVFELPHATSLELAEERAAALTSFAVRLRRAGKVHKIVTILKAAAGMRHARQIESVAEAVRILAEGESEAKQTVPTFGSIANDWTSGRLHRIYPDYVKEIGHEDNKERLKKYAFPILEHVPITEITLAEIEAVMGSIDKARSPATRRHVAQVIARVMNIAVYPLKHIAASPLPKGFLPKVGKHRAASYLYPAEEAILTSCEAIPIERRLVYALLAREGMRASELFALEWSDMDLETGFLSLDENKTDDPRTWVMGADVVRALGAIKAKAKPEESARIVTEIPVEKLAKTFRADLEQALDAAKKKRSQLFEHSKSRMRIRAHDLRATFVTLALAAGKSEAWVTDRTGHTSSQTVSIYRRAARAAVEANLGWLRPLDQLLDHGRTTLQNRDSETAEDESNDDP